MLDGKAVLAAGTTRETMLPYGRQCVTEEDIRLVVEVLRGDWLTTGPMVERFERALARQVGAADAVAVSSGTAALHAAMFALGIGPGDEVIVPAMTFAATANCVVFQGGTPVFADVSPDTLLDRPGRRPAADHAADAGDHRRRLCRPAVRLPSAAGACHGAGAGAGRRRLARPGGCRRAVAGGKSGRPDDLQHAPGQADHHGRRGHGRHRRRPELAERMRRFRNHGFTRDHHRAQRRRRRATRNDRAGLQLPADRHPVGVGAGPIGEARRLARPAGRDRRPLRPGVGGDWKACGRWRVRPGVRHAWHLYVVRLDSAALGIDRQTAYETLTRERIGVAVHYLPVHLHPFYREHFGTCPGQCPNAEAAYEEILSLPIFAAMTDDDVDDVLRAVEGLGDRR